MLLTEKELHLMALQKSEDSKKIHPSMTVVRLGFVTSMLIEMQNNFKKIIEEKDLQITELKTEISTIKIKKEIEMEKTNGVIQDNDGVNFGIVGKSGSDKSIFLMFKNIEDKYTQDESFKNTVNTMLFDKKVSLHLEFTEQLMKLDTEQIFELNRIIENGK